jgi:hypothetical protein
MIISSYANRTVDRWTLEYQPCLSNAQMRAYPTSVISTQGTTCHGREASEPMLSTHEQPQALGRGPEKPLVAFYHRKEVPCRRR